MTKARTLADFISDGSPLADGTISVSEVSGAAPLANPTFTGGIDVTGTIDSTDYLTAKGLRIGLDNNNDIYAGNNPIRSTADSFYFKQTSTGEEFIRFEHPNVVVNEFGYDHDFRVEGTSDSNVLAVNAGNNRVGVGTNGGLHKLSVLHTGTALGGVAHFSIGSAAAAYATTVFRVDDVDNNFAIDQNYASQDRNRLFIKRANGYVGIGGVTSPSAMLHVESNGSGNYAAVVRHTQATNPNGLWINYSNSGYIDTYALRISNTDGVIWDQRGTGSLMHYAQDGATVRFNTGAANVDFQVKSDSQSNAFFVDASTGEIVTNTYGFNIYNYDDGPNLNISSGRDYNSLMMGAAANYGSNNSTENKWSWNWRGRPASSSEHYNFLYDEIGNQEYFRVQADVSQYAVVVNDGGHNHDFRVESDNQSHCFFVNAGNDTVNIGSSLQQNTKLTVYAKDSGTTANWGEGEYTGISVGIANTVGRIGGIGFTNVDSAGGDMYCGIGAVMTSGGGVGIADLVFWAKANGSNVPSLERMRIEGASGHVVINEQSYDQDFRVESDSNANQFVVDAGQGMVGFGRSSPASANAGVKGISIYDGASAGISIESGQYSQNWLTWVNSGGSYEWYNETGNVARMTLSIGGALLNSANSYGALSDQRIKQDIVAASSQWDDVKAIQVKNYRLIADVENQGDAAPNLLGVIAQDLEASGMGGLVDDGSRTVPDGNGIITGPQEETKSVKYSILYMKAVKALQEAMDRIETLEAKVTALENA
ncbi:hypothetical protein CRP235_gp33 [Roseobacter phage CRP-235]|nr:hypothetical protein CRP235_gp33 [Roseobacter phage CRP-235]